MGFKRGRGHTLGKLNYQFAPVMRPNFFADCKSVALVQARQKGVTASCIVRAVLLCFAF